MLEGVTCDGGQVEQGRGYEGNEGAAIVSEMLVWA